MKAIYCAKIYNSGENLTVDAIIITIGMLVNKTAYSNYALKSKDLRWNNCEIAINRRKNVNKAGRIDDVGTGP